ncbi:MAG TPA: heparinase II/III family protein, partial [Sandaracinaceae bacterium LLY-WYZ-13_1]|nr:heparinase II/III family protein [Sandaracinaceae bacterium LLY-WYZ-13_1]
MKPGRRLGWLGIAVLAAGCGDATSADPRAPAEPARCAPAAPDVACGLEAERWHCLQARLVHEGLSRELAGELTGADTASLDEALTRLFGVLHGRRWIDEPVTPPGPRLVVDGRWFPPETVATPLDWTVDPVGDRSWRLWYQSLSWLDWLWDAEARDVGAAPYVVVAWARDALPREPPLELTWDRHATAARLARAYAFLRRYAQTHETVNRRVVVAAARIVLSHLYTLARDPCYDHGHNHGFMQDGALLRHALAIGDGLTDTDALVRLAEDRLVNEQLAVSIGPDGVHRENSPHYHLTYAELIDALLTDVYAVHERPPPHALLSARNDLLMVVPHLMQPNGTLPQIGDTPNTHRHRALQRILQHTTSAHPLPPHIRAPLAWIVTSGSEGHPPTGTQRVYPDGGYAVFRSGWAAPSLTDPVVAHFRCARPTSIHRHDDETTFSLYGWGQELVVDPGRYANDRTRPLASWAAGAQAHNVLTVDGAPF